MDVVNTINEAEKALEIAKNQGLTLDFSYLENLIEKAKQCLINNDYSNAIEYAEQALSELESANDMYIAPARNQVLNEIQEIKNFVYNLRRLEVDVSDTEDIYKEIQTLLNSASSLSDYEKLMSMVGELKKELERLKEEKERLDEMPKAISNSMREIKQEVGFLKTKNIETYSIEEKLQEAVDLFATAEAEEEYQRIMGQIEKVRLELDKVKEGAEKANEKKNTLMNYLYQSETIIEELETSGYDVSIFKETKDEFMNIVNESTNPDELDVLDEQIKDFIVQLQDAIEKSRQILGLKQTAMNEVEKLKAISTELVEIGGDIQDYEEGIRDIVKSFNESSQEDDFKTIIQRIDDMIPVVREKIDKIHEEKRQKEVVFTEISAIEEDIGKLEEFTDTTEANDMIAGARELLESKEYEAALAELDKCRQIVFNLNDAQPVFEVKIDTEDVEPDNWAQTDMILTNTGKAHAKNIVITLDGPVEIRKLKPIAILKAGEETTQKVGIKFTDRGEIPLDIQIHCFRVKDASEFNFNIDYWASVGVAQAQKMEKPLVTIISPEGGETSFEGGEGGEKSPDMSAPPEIPEPPLDLDDDEEDVYTKDTREEGEADKDIIKRMKKLEELKQLGLISEDEYNEKRKELLANL
jgi:hypothetical protein